MTIFSRIHDSTLPKPQDIFTSYYIYQSFYQNLTGVINDLKKYLELVNMKDSFQKYKTIYDDTINFFYNYYINNDKEDKNVIFDNEMYTINPEINLDINLSCDNNNYKSIIETHEIKKIPYYILKI